MFSEDQNNVIKRFIDLHEASTKFLADHNDAVREIETASINLGETLKEESAEDVQTYMADLTSAEAAHNFAGAVGFHEGLKFAISVLSDHADISGDALEDTVNEIYQQSMLSLFNPFENAIQKALDKKTREDNDFMNKCLLASAAAQKSGNPSAFLIPDHMLQKEKPVRVQ